MRQSVRRPSPLLLSLLAALLAASACAASGGDDDGGAAADAAAEAPAEAELKDAPNGDLARRSTTDDSLAYGDELANATLDGVTELARTASDNDAPDRKIIAKGNVSLESDDVADAAFRATELADRHGGEVTERETMTNKAGEISHARLLLRIPVESFDEAFTGLQEVADLKSADTGKEDVTTKVIDTQVRIRAQRRSLARVEQLFDRAQSIGDIIRIESQVSRRQADLESLERRLDYLTDQTSMSTIAVNISLPPKKEKEDKKKDEPEEAGFLAGLDDGWDALKSFGTDVSTLSGRLLPWVPLLLLVGAPLWVFGRRFLRHRVVAAAPAPAADASA